MQIADADYTTLKLMMDHLAKQLAVEEREVLLAVDVFGTRAVWMRESTEWVKQCYVPDECPDMGVCVSRMSDGLVVIGGYEDLDEERHEASSLCYHFALSTGQWRKLENMATPRVCASAAEVRELKMLVVGGWKDRHVSDVCEWLDVRRGVWTPAASLPEPLGDQLVAAAAGRVYILQHCALYGSNFPLVEYDPVSDTHTHKTSVPDDVSDTQGSSLVGVANKIYLFGGEEKLALQYEPATEQWHQLVPFTAMVTMQNTGYYPMVKSADILLCVTNPEYDCETYGESDHSDSQRRTISYNVETKQWKILDFCLPF